MLRLVVLTSLVGLIGLSVSTSFAEDDFGIPLWIKDIASFWSQDKISDTDFLQGIEYLIDNDLLHIERLESIKDENRLLKTENGILLKEIDEISDKLTADGLSITLYTSKSEYGPEDHIVIFGTVNKIIDDQKISIVISNPKGTFMSITKVAPNLDGSYAFVANDPKFKEFGEYSVNVYYAGKVYQQTDYSFKPKLQSMS